MSLKRTAGQRHNFHDVIDLNVRLSNKLHLAPQPLSAVVSRCIISIRFPGQLIYCLQKRGHYKLTRNRTFFSRYKQLSFWNKIGAIGSIASIVGLLIYFIPSIDNNEYDFNVLGVLPVHLYEGIDPTTAMRILKETYGDSAKKGSRRSITASPTELSTTQYGSHRLAMIFKIRNDSPANLTVHAAVIEGCIPIYILNEMNLVNNERGKYGPRNEGYPDEGTFLTFLSGKQPVPIQRIRMSGIVRGSNEERLLNPNDITYIGVLFPLKAQSTILIAPGSASLEKDCSKIPNFNTQPSIDQIFVMDFENIWPGGLRSEFRNSQLKISLWIGKQQLSIDPKLLRKMISQPESIWADILLAQTYENPEFWEAPSSK